MSGLREPHGGNIVGFWMLDAEYAPGSQGYTYFWMSYAVSVVPQT